VPLAEANRILSEALTRFADAIADGRRSRLMARVSTGVGKTERVIAMIPRLIAAAHRGGWSGAAVIAVPRHELGDEIAERLAQVHPTLRVRQWRGMAARDPNNPGSHMCAWPDLPRAALAAGLTAMTPCRTCAVRPACSYHRQQADDADVCIVAHHAMFRPLPEGMPPVCLTITDEAWWSAGLAGGDQDGGCGLPIAALACDETGALCEERATRLGVLRARLAAAIARLDADQPLSRLALEAEGLTAEALQELAELEQAAAPPVPALPAEAAAAQRVLESLSGHREAQQRARLAQLAGNLLDRQDAFSEAVRVTTGSRDVPSNGGTAPEGKIELAWREELAEWVQRAPVLMLDATTHPDVVLPWLGGAELGVLDVEAAMLHARVRQVVGHEWSRRHLTRSPEAIRDLARFMLVELARATGDVLAVLQAAAEQRLREEIQALCGGTWPERLHVAHHGAITGTNAYRHAERVVVVGRPALSVAAGERIAALLRSGLGDAPRLTQDGDVLWPTRAAGIRLRSGGGLAVRQPTHPDPLVDAIRISVSEGAVMQAVGRLRSVQRREPTAITILGELALPITVDEVVHWDVVRPNRLVLAAAQAALARQPLLLSAEGLHACRSDLWGTVTAARRDLEERVRDDNNTPPALLIMDTLQTVGGCFPMQAFEYRLPQARGPWSRALVPAGVDALTALRRVRADVVAARPLHDHATERARPSLALVVTHVAPSTSVSNEAPADAGAA
jgi:hypothetical protein